jgi:heterodisulfide reductase subunit A
MAQWGKVFPTLDCSACILTPKMTTAAHHPNITLLTYSEIKGVTGSIGNFEVKIEKKPRYINIKKCTGCGVCAQKCPVRVPNEFDFGISSRKAVYIPFSQAVPAIYTIDKDQCLYFTKGICQVCKKFCSANAIEFDQKPEEITVKVGTIIVATGFDPFDPTVIEQYGYKLYKNVITGPIIERMASAFGPTSGKIVRPSDNREPKKVAFLTCVGSRDAKLNLRYCSRVCCMYTMKAALLLKEQNPGIEVHIIYMDIRAFGKGYEEFYVRTQEKGVRFIRGKVSSISEDKTTKDLILRYEDTLLGKIMEERYDLVVLAVGQVPRQDAEVIGRLLNIPKGIDGFFMEAHVKLRPHDTPTDGIYLAGSCQYPKDIADTVSQASGAAARAAIPMSRGVVEVEAAIPSVIKEKCGGCRICEAVCPFNAIEMKKEKDKLIASINEALCKGCGACSAACPATALEMGYLTDEQILAQVDCVAY